MARESAQEKKKSGSLLVEHLAPEMNWMDR